MGYCTIQDLRAEGVGVSDASGSRLQALIDEASGLIEQICGWYFEERSGQTLVLDGSGTITLHLPVPALEVTELRRVYRTTAPTTSFTIDPTAYVVYSRREPGNDDRRNPKIQLLGATGDTFLEPWRIRFTRGLQNYEVDGTFGYVDDDPQNPGTGITPPAIKRACIMLVAHMAGQLGDPDAEIERRGIDLRSLRVMGESMDWEGPRSGNTASGLPEVDRILARYRAPWAMRAA